MLLKRPGQAVSTEALYLADHDLLCPRVVRRRRRIFGRWGLRRRGLRLELGSDSRNLLRPGIAGRRLRVLSPLRSEGALRGLRYGRVRLRPDGTEIGPVRPGDL